MQAVLSQLLGFLRSKSELNTFNWLGKFVKNVPKLESCNPFYNSGNQKQIETF